MIGIGNFDYDNIDDLKKTNFIVKNSFGEKSKRNLVQFVNLDEKVNCFFILRNNGMSNFLLFYLTNKSIILI